MLVASWFIGMCLNIIVYCFLFCKFTGVEKFRINYKIITFCFIGSLIYVLLSKNNLLVLRLIINHLFTYFGLLFLYKYDWFKTLIAELCIFIIISISEILFGCCLIFIFNNDVQVFLSNYVAYLFANIIICAFSCLIASAKVSEKIIILFLKWYDKNNYLSIIFFVILCMNIFIFFLYNNYIGVLPRTLLFITNLFSVGVIFFVISYFKEKSANNRIISEYDQLLNYVQKYEKIVEDKSKSQHEYKNQLILLKGMISKSNKVALKYIDDLNNELKENENIELLNKLRHLPSGGLKGLIFYKLEEMYEKNINVFVDISSEMEKISIDERINRNLKDISKVIGVYIDNAIEACLYSKEKYIILEFYIEDDNWVFSISNTYSNAFDISKMEEAGYTTKGDGKGYGLSLVKDILNHNDSLYSDKSLNGIYYVQKLYIKK